MKAELSQSDRMIIAATEAGYYASPCGRVFDKSNREVVGSPLKHSKHLRLTMYADGVNNLGYCSVLKHRFIYYYFHGDRLFSSALVRHRNDIANDNRISNLIAGSHKENRADVPKSRLSEIGKNNAAALIERSRRLSDEDVLSMRQLRGLKNISYAEIAKSFDVSAMTAYRAINKQSWSNL